MSEAFPPHHKSVRFEKKDDDDEEDDEVVEVEVAVGIDEERSTKRVKFEDVDNRSRLC